MSAKQQTPELSPYIYDTELEACVLGDILTEPALASKAMQYIKTPEVFVNDFHKLVWEAIVSVKKQGWVPDLESVTVWLRKNKAAEVSKYTPTHGNWVTDLTWLTVRTSFNFEKECMVLFELFYKRRLKEMGYRLMDGDTLFTKDPLEITEGTKKYLHGIDALLPDKKQESLLDVADKITGNIGRSEHYTTWGVKMFDEVMIGQTPGQFNLIAARPSMGKTAFTCFLLREIAVKRKIPAAILSLEQSSDQILTRITSAYAGFSAQEIARGLCPGDILTNSLREVVDSPLHIHDKIVPLSGIESIINSWVLKGVKVVFVDYIQRIQDPKSKSEYDKITNVSQVLKDMAKQYNITINALSQLSRECETRDGFKKRPQLSDLRGSGSLEQDADCIMFLFRPEYYGEELSQYPSGEPTTGITEIHLRKNREGEVRMDENHLALFHDLALNKYFESYSEYTRSVRSKYAAPAF